MEFAQLASWQGLLHFGGLSILMLLANVLRRKIPFLRRSLLPTAVIAGFIGLAVKETLFTPLFGQTQYNLTMVTLRLITYHAIALGFIALGLKSADAVKLKLNNNKSMFSGLLIVSTYLLQGLIALSLTIVFSYTIFTTLFPAAGMLFPLGFGQGPGQAHNIGSLYENDYGFVGGTSFGLAIASFGFLWASIAGVIYLNTLVKQKRLTRQAEHKSGLVSSQEIESPDEIPVAEAIDKFTIQTALVLTVYVFTFGFIYGVVELMRAGVLGDFGMETVAPLIVGFNFIVGMLFALLFKRIFIGLRKINLMTRQYPNNYMLNRIAGTVFDFMIVAAISAIRIEDLRGLWVPFLIISLIIGAVTLVYVIKMTKRIYPEYPIEASLGMFGMLTGTASTGVVLLREADPNFETPAANDLVVGSTTAIMFGFPVLLLVGIAPRSTLSTFITLGLIVVLTALVVGILLKLNPKQTKS